MWQLRIVSPETLTQRCGLDGRARRHRLRGWLYRPRRSLGPRLQWRERPLTKPDVHPTLLACKHRATAVQRAPVEHPFPIEVVPEEGSTRSRCHAEPKGGELGLAALGSAAEVDEHRHEPVARRAYVESKPDVAGQRGPSGYDWPEARRTEVPPWAYYGAGGACYARGDPGRTLVGLAFDMAPRPFARRPARLRKRSSRRGRGTLGQGCSVPPVSEVWVQG